MTWGLWAVSIAIGAFKMYFVGIVGGLLAAVFGLPIVAVAEEAGSRRGLILGGIQVVNLAVVVVALMVMGGSVGDLDDLAFVLGWAGSAVLLVVTLPLALATWHRPLAGQDPCECRRCGYPLIGLAAPRCPECGTPFDPVIIERTESDA